MSKLNQIETKLQQLDGGAFQKLADSYLTKKGHEPIYPIGSVTGSNKTKIGTPDTLTTSASGKYIFVEYTTIEEKKVKKKFSEDIRKCLDVTKTKISHELIEEIILCYNREMSVADINELRQLGADSNINVSVFTNGSISHGLLEKFPGVAKDHLGVDVDTGQIVSLDDFKRYYEKNELATSLSTKFYFRENERILLLESLKNNRITLISGRLGIGKSRLAIECYESFSKKHSDYKAFCIFNKSVDIYDDIRAYFSDSGKYLIFIDDANRISGFQYIVDLLLEQREDQEFKILVTVRDYALDKVLGICKKTSPIQEISINPFSDDEIRGLLREEFNIENTEFLERITRISQGNPRVAVMAAEAAVTANTLESIRDVSAIYDAYYSSMKNDLLDLGNKEVLVSAGIVSFMGSIDRTNENHAKVISEVFGFSMDDFWDSAIILHDMECVDIFENEVVKVSDQILATYLLYLVFFKTKVLDYSIILKRLFPSHKRRIIDSLYPVLSAFDYESVKEVIVESVTEVWDKYQIEDKSKFEEFLKLFWFLKPTETLIYIGEQIKKESIVKVSIEEIEYQSNSKNSLPAYIHVLSSFRVMKVENPMSVDLLMQFAEKRQDCANDILHLLVEDYGFQTSMRLFLYATELDVTKKLISKCREGDDLYFSKMFILFSEQMLKTKFSRYSQSNKMTVTITNFELRESKEIRELRNLIYEFVFTLIEVSKLKEHVKQFFISHSNNRYDLSNTEIIENDAKTVLIQLTSKLDSDDIIDCVIANDYGNLLKRCSIDFESNLLEHYQTRSYKLYDLFTNTYEKREMELSQEEYREYKKTGADKIVESLSPDECLGILNDFRTIIDVYGNHSKYTLNAGVYALFESMSEYNIDKYVELLRKYLDGGDILTLDPINPLTYLMREMEHENVLTILLESTYPSQPTWVLCYYARLTDTDIEASDPGKLIEIYETAQPNYLIDELDCFLKYESKEFGLIAQLCRIVLERSKSDTKFQFKFELLLYPHTESNKRILELFEGNLGLLEEVYLDIVQSGSISDYDGGTLSRILDVDPTFITRYIDAKYEGKAYFNKYDDSTDYNFIWERSDYIELMDRVSESVYQWEKQRYGQDYLEKFFSKNVHPQSDGKILEKQDTFLEQEILKKNCNSDYMKFLFRIVSGFDRSRSVKFYKLFLENNNDFSDFETLPKLPVPDSWTGSAVPMHQARLECVEELINLCSSVHLLPHRELLEEHSSDIRKTIKQYRKEDFTED